MTPQTFPTILVVDDESAIRELAASILTEEGYQVLEASDGLAAFDIVERSHVDLVLSDIMMSSLDGYGLVRCLRSHGHVLPVVLMSAVTPALDGTIPGVRFLAKPFAIEQLCHTVSAALQARKARRGRDLAAVPSHLLSVVVA